MTIHIPHKPPITTGLPIERREFLSLMLAGLATTLPMDAIQAAPMGPMQSQERVSRTLSTFVDVLIPADELTPSASTLGIAQKIMAEASNSALLKRLLRVVTDWLNKSSNTDFESMDEKGKGALIEWMSTAPWESPQRRFFEIVRDQAMWFYYGNPESYSGLDIQSSPQPAGYVLE